MTNGEEENNEVNQVPEQSTPETNEANEVPEQSAPETTGVNQVPNQSPPEKSSKKPILYIVGAIVAICCIGFLALFGLGLMSGEGGFSFDLFNPGPKYTNETVSGFTFKIPVEYEKMKADVNGMVEFKNDTNKFIRIEGSDKKYDIYTWSLAVSYVLGGITGNKVDLNGTAAYRFETEDVIVGGPTEQTVYVYALNLEGKSFIIILSKGIENPNDFLTSMIS